MLQMRFAVAGDGLHVTVWGRYGLQGSAMLHLGAGCMLQLGELWVVLYRWGQSTLLQLGVDCMLQLGESACGKALPADAK